MLLSIVVLNYKSAKLTRECVKGILNCDLPFEYEIIVVDNDSKDQVCDLIKERFPRVKCIENRKNLGMGAGNNVGIKAAQGKYIMIINPDTVPSRKSFVPLVEFFESHPRAGIVAPKVLNPDKSHQTTVHEFPRFWMPLWRRTPLGKTKWGKQYLSEYTVNAQELQQARTVDWMFGPAFVIRKSLAEEISGYDERFFLFFEDTDLCRRAWQSGFEVWYVPEAKIVHYPHRVSEHNLGLWSLRKKTTWNHIASWLRYFWKWRNTAIDR